MDRASLVAATNPHYESMLARLILPVLGDAKIVTLTPAKVRQWHSELGPTNATRNAHAYALLHAICATAVQDEVLDANPCRIRAAMQTKRKRDVDVLTPTEVDKLAAKMPAGLRASVVLAAWCGLRWGETSELRRSDVSAAQPEELPEYWAAQLRCDRRVEQCAVHSFRRRLPGYRSTERQGSTGGVGMKIKHLMGAAATAAVLVSVGGVPPAWAADGLVFGLEQRINDPNGGEIAYTLTKFRPSADAIPYPVSGQLYEVTVRADEINGLVTPVIPAFSARAESGQSYPALAGFWTPQGFSGATLLPGGHSTGKIYFDAVGDPPTSVVYNNAGDMLTWIEAPSVPPSEAAASNEGDSGGGADGGGGSTGPNQAGPQTTPDAGGPSGVTGSDAGGGGLGQAPGASGGGGLGGVGG